MSKKRKTPRRTKAKAQTVADTPTRRNTLRLMGFGALGAVVLGGAGLFSVNAVQATMSEYDLSKIGNGTPYVVQIHDPACSLCTALQRETRQALRQFSDTELDYLVANITTQDGAAFANRHGVPNVTLLLFDGDGEVRQVISGVQDKADLVEAFSNHIAGAPAS